MDIQYKFHNHNELRYKKRARGGGGGVAIIWRSSIAGICEITNIIHDRICGIRLSTDKEVSSTSSRCSYRLRVQGRIWCHVWMI